MGIFPFEDTPNYSPYIHTGQDKIGPSVNSPEMAKTFIQANLACLASLAIPYDSTVGINPRPGIVSEVRVFPNPANDVISVSNTKGKTMQVKLTSTAGQALARTRIKGQGMVDVSFLTPGIYFIQCTGDDVSETVRFIKK
jgi:hypothetical protein